MNNHIICILYNTVTDYINNTKTEWIHSSSSKSTTVVEPYIHCVSRIASRRDIHTYIINIILYIDPKSVHLRSTHH